MESKLENIHAGKYQWPSPEQYGEITKLVFSTNVPDFLSFYNGNEVFAGLTHEQKEYTARLIGHFFIGIKTAYERFGNKYNDAQLSYTTQNDNFELFAYFPEHDRYAANLNTIMRIAKDPERFLRTHESVGGIASFESLEDMFELAGVEEAAHRIFYKEKKIEPNKQVKIGKKYDYYVVDEEYRALYWKAGYIKHYKPQYLSSINETIDGAQVLRQRIKDQLALDDLPNVAMNRWPTDGQYQYNKQDIYSENHEKLMAFFESNNAFSGMDSEMKAIAIKLYSNFFIGAQTISRRLGDKTTEYSFTFDESEESEYGVFGVNGSGEFIIHIKEFIDLIRQIRNGDNLEIALGAQKEMKLEDIVELAGVELGSHAFLYRRGRTERPPEEMALRAMVCKKAYAKRYLPHCKDAFESANEENLN